MRQWTSLSAHGLVALHHRAAVEAAGVEAVKRGGALPKNLFDCKWTLPRIGTDTLVQRATWPTLSAQTLQGLAAGQHLLSECHKRTALVHTGNTWKGVVRTHDDCDCVQGHR